MCVQVQVQRDIVGSTDRGGQGVGEVGVEGPGVVQAVGPEDGVGDAVSCVCGGGEGRGIRVNRRWG